jgi:hypothetical protein
LRFIGGSKLRGLLTNWIFWLILITGMAVIIRSLPAWIHAAWGCDFGIYFGITKSVAQSGLLFPQYTGWGGSYNEFPVLYAINAFAHLVTGIDIITLMPKLTPIFGGLSVLIFYFIAHKIINNKKIALLSTLFFAFLPFHVYQTSHASPLTMGHFFIMISLFLFLKYRENTKYILPLIISTILLIMSHHLSTYFYLISLIGIILVENASSKEWTFTFKKDILYILVTSLLIFIYWGLVAKTVFEQFMSGFTIGGIHFESIFIILIFYVFLAFLFTFGIRFFRRLSVFIIKHRESVKNPILKIFILIICHLNPFIKKKWPSTKSRFIYFFLVIAILLGVLLFYSTTNMPWLGFSLTIGSIIIAFPFIIAITFGVVGFRYMWYIKNGLFIRGWTFALLFSLIIMIITNNKTLYPHRHPEYLMAPLAILMVYGIGGLFSDPFYKGLLSKMKSKKEIYVSNISGKIKIIQKNRLIYFFMIILLITSLAATTYEVHRALSQSWEEITNEDINSIGWIGENLDKNTSIIASDHRLERMAESEGFNTTDDEVIKLWDAENASEYIDELLGIGKNYSRITHVIVDDIMKDNGVHIGPKKGKFRTIYMTNETWTDAYDKFNSTDFPIFNMIYKNETIAKNPMTNIAVHWTEVYEVNWTYIESFI